LTFAGVLSNLLFRPHGRLLSPTHDSLENLSFSPVVLIFRILLSFFHFYVSPPLLCRQRFEIDPLGFLPFPPSFLQLPSPIKLRAPDRIRLFMVFEFVPFPSPRLAAFPCQPFQTPPTPQRPEIYLQILPQMSLDPFDFLASWPLFTTFNTRTSPELETLDLGFKLPSPPPTFSCHQSPTIPF